MLGPKASSRRPEALFSGLYRPKISHYIRYIEGFVLLAYP
jgi:hypothetical protein